MMKGIFLVLIKYNFELKNILDKYLPLIKTLINNIDNWVLNF